MRRVAFLEARDLSFSIPPSHLPSLPPSLASPRTNCSGSTTAKSVVSGSIDSTTARSISRTRMLSSAPWAPSQAG
ncbi:hypothetical protein Naga_104134g1 [Nannochloropsis gaditana]|uniref:Uncharacterized protein n=1 Tax=Nannochloropsis gaditana TaxID=72520 RepID=W7TQ82_9STRA|nr:hypothetical protein Naga_104134g1 [Nannochloropsis gaditana]